MSVGARRPDPRVADRRGAACATGCRRRSTLRDLGRRAPARPRAARARLPGRASRSCARRFRRCARSQATPQQPAAAAHLVRRPRARAGRRRRATPDDAAAHARRHRRARQEPPVAARSRPTRSTTIRTACGSSSSRPVSDPRLVPQAIASVLGVKEEPGAGRSREALRELRARPTLLLIVLDNCEHSRRPAPKLAREHPRGGAGRRGSCARAASGSTSRGEKTYPARAARRRIAATSSYARGDRAVPGVRLFVERATAATCRLRGDRATMRAAVAEICHRLDGIPLALELAAARVRAMSVQAIAERLVGSLPAAVAAATAPRCRASRHCARSSTGATTCWERSEQALFRTAGGIRGRLHAGGRGRGRRRATPSTSSTCSIS